MDNLYIHVYIENIDKITGNIHEAKTINACFGLCYNYNFMVLPVILSGFFNNYGYYTVKILKKYRPYFMNDKRKIINSKIILYM